MGLSIACSPGPPPAGMLTYGLAVALYLAGFGFTGDATAALLRPAVVFRLILSGVLAYRFAAQWRGARL